ncbi:MAG: cyclic nucleotide-binding domain-containing protein, partial [Deltaproteobacteria bacterium]|nr:cyclic nucleotide-binding domain-containing protein [Deltaproteobacteria bacterium]
MNDLADTIRNVPLFSGLPREDIAKILGKLEEKSFVAGATVFSQGEKGDAFYIVQSGAVQVVLQSAGGRSEVISILGPQDCFGEMALLSGEPRSATIIAVKDTTVWRLSREDWDELIEKHPTWLLHFCATLSRRLTHAEKQYSQGRDAFNTLAEEFYSSRPAEEQAFLRHAALLTTIDLKTAAAVLQTEKAQEFLNNIVKSQLPLIRALDGKGYELHGFFRDFLGEKLVAMEGKETREQLHAQFAERYESLSLWDHAIHHF